MMDQQKRGGPAGPAVDLQESTLRKLAELDLREPVPAGEGGWLAAAVAYASGAGTSGAADAAGLRDLDRKARQRFRMRLVAAGVRSPNAWPGKGGGAKRKRGAAADDTNNPAQRKRRPAKRDGASSSAISANTGGGGVVHPPTVGEPYYRGGNGTPTDSVNSPLEGVHAVSSDDPSSYAVAERGGDDVASLTGEHRQLLARHRRDIARLWREVRRTLQDPALGAGPRGSRTTALEQLSRVVQRLIALERQAAGVDAAQERSRQAPGVALGVVVVPSKADPAAWLRAFAGAASGGGAVSAGGANVSAGALSAEDALIDGVSADDDDGGAGNQGGGDAG